jgi:putative nucleotidyltransferase with HDIG domain
MAVSDMGGNPILARVGGYYHDVGKLYHPQYFKENQMMDNPHDLLEPTISAKIIKQHIKDGMEIATSYKLPRVIKDIIQQHHGTTLIKYFYYKALKESVITEVTEEDFRYKGPKPQNKETAAILLADTVEAAVRAAMPNKQSMKDIEILVRILIKEKLDDGQLEESTLTIKDLDIICVSFMKVFSGMYHERIPYPTMDKKEADEDADLD